MHGGAGVTGGAWRNLLHRGRQGLSPLTLNHKNTVHTYTLITNIGVYLGFYTVTYYVYLLCMCVPDIFDLVLSSTNRIHGRVVERSHVSASGS